MKERRYDVRYRIDDGKIPNLIVEVPTDSLKAFGDFKDPVDKKPLSNAQTLARVAGVFPGILSQPIKTRLVRQIAESSRGLGSSLVDAPPEVRFAEGGWSSLSRLAEDIVRPRDKDRATPRMKSVGSSFKVTIVTKGDGQVVFTGNPPQSEVLQSLTQQIAETRQRVSEYHGRLGNIARAEKTESDLDDLLPKVQTIFRYARAGAKYEDIEEAVGMHQSTFKRWLTGQGVPVGLHLRSEALMDANMRPAPQHMQEDPEYACLLGAISSRTKAGSVPSRIEFKSDSIPCLTLFRGVLLQDRGAEEDELPIREKAEASEVTGGAYAIASTGNAIRGHFSEVSDRNTRVPFEHLGTKEEKAMWLAGVLSQSWKKEARVDGRVNPLFISKRDGVDLIKGVAVVMADLGIYPAVFIEKGIPQLMITDPIDAQALLSKVVDKVPEDIIPDDVLFTIKQVAGKTSTKSVPLGAFHLFEELNDGTLMPKQMAERLNDAWMKRTKQDLGFEGPNVKSWLNGARPNIAKRFDAIQAIRDGMPSPERINDLYRNHGFSSSDSRYIAGLELQTRLVPKEDTVREISLEIIQNKQGLEDNAQVAALYFTYLHEHQPELSSEAHRTFSTSRLKDAYLKEISALLRDGSIHLDGPPEPVRAVTNPFQIPEVKKVFDEHRGGMDMVYANTDARDELKAAGWEIIRIRPLEGSEYRNYSYKLAPIEEKKE